MRMRKPFQIAGILFFLILLIGVGIRLGFERRRVIPVPILMYHRIGDAADSPWWVTPRDFEMQLAGLREQGYQSVMPSDLVAHQRWGWPLPQKPVLITMDDGYLNALENAEPLLKQYGFKAVCYLITGLVGESPEKRMKWEGTSLLVWPEVRAMQKRGVIGFGGHSRNHLNLRAMPDPGGEIAACYRDIRRMGRFRPEGFCYPSGQYIAKTQACVKKAGFTTATTCDDGVAVMMRGTNLLELPRVVVMGGRHDFHVVLRPASKPGITVAVSLTGAPLELVPRLTWSTNQAFEQGWLPPVILSSSPTTLSWDVPESASTTGPILELWDHFRVVRFLRSPLTVP